MPRQPPRRRKRKAGAVSWRAERASVCYDGALFFEESASGPRGIQRLAAAAARVLSAQQSGGMASNLRQAFS
ncbi:hypothetical protein VZ52_09050 [Ralstonia mannitolilytica]|nr:hypothetical protein VZ52_09050 [Ralstonia mannitolilytica]